MGSPQTTNGLMRHLRNDCNISISGSYQKQQLISYGYFHGYKGYRFFKKRNTQIPYTDFSEIVAIIEFDNNLKSVLYSELMFIETAIKNIVCNESIEGLKLASFEHIFQNRMKDELSNTKLQSKRLKLRNSVYSKLSTRYRDEEENENQMVRHFYGRGEDAPLWVIFEILYLSDLASYFECLNKPIREKIMTNLNMFDSSVDTYRTLLSNLLYTLKALRNAVAHNNIIFDTRFKDRNINRIIKKWVEKETSIQNITLFSLFDYIIIMCCILKRIDFNNTRAVKLLNNYKNEIQHLKEQVTTDIYNIIIPQNTGAKIADLETYLSK